MVPRLQPRQPNTMEEPEARVELVPIPLLPFGPFPVKSFSFIKVGDGGRRRLES
jgi:hypothetical protein